LKRLWKDSTSTLSILKKATSRVVRFTKTYSKVLVVFTAFALMIISSCLIMNNTLNRKLGEHAESSIDDAQSLIRHILTEPLVVIDFMADTIEDIIRSGQGFEAVMEQMRFYTADEFKERIPNFSYDSIFGFFDIFNEFYEGGGWVPGDTYRPRERPWYTGAIENRDNVITTPVYIDTATLTPVIAYARSLSDDSGNLLGVVAIDVPISFVNELLDSEISTNSYGFIVDNQSIVVAHPSDDFIGTYLTDSNPYLTGLMYNIHGSEGITRTDYISYTGVKSILFSSATFNGWYVNFVIPEAEYYRDLYNMMVIVTMLGIVLATALSLLLIRIERARKFSELKSRQKSTFLANMSHEIRTPMNSIIGFSELALDDNIPTKTRQYLKSITDNAKWLLNILNDILDSSKIESGNMVLEHIPFDLQDVISQCQSAILPKAAEKGIALFCYAEPIENKTLIGDPVRLRQVFMNLLSNGIKFTNTGVVKLLSYVKDVKEDKAVIGFEVKDSGIGMTPEQIKSVFQPFIQGDDSVSRKYGGTGLGLPIAKNIIELMGGTLKVESKPGEGSVFSFELLIDLINADLAIEHSGISTVNIDRPNFDGEVLVCEDNALNRQVICEHLARVGLRTVIADNGKEAVNIIAGRLSADASDLMPFDLIFMDIHMPVMDGLEASMKIKSMDVKAPIVALTANVMSNDLELYKASGMNDYLGKPFTTQELWRCLLKYFAIVSYSEVNADELKDRDNQSLKQLRRYFARNNTDTVESIGNAIDNGDLKLAHRLVHTLKGNAGQIEELHLKDEAAMVEKLISDGNIPAAKAELEALKTQLRVVLSRLNPLLTEADEQRVIKATDPETVSVILGKLEQMLERNNPECMNLLDDIRTIPGSEKLAEYVEEFEFKKALEELKKL